MIPVSIVLFVRNINKKGFELWMQPRTEGGPTEGLLEFPGGKITPSESSREAAVREVYEEVQFKITEAELDFFKLVCYDLEEKSLALHVFTSFRKDVPTKVGDWFTVDYKTKSEKYREKIPAINHEIIDELADYLFIQKDTKLEELRAP